MSLEQAMHALTEQTKELEKNTPEFILLTLSEDISKKPSDEKEFAVKISVNIKEEDSLKFFYFAIEDFLRESGFDFESYMEEYYSNKGEDEIDDSEYDDDDDEDGGEFGYGNQGDFDGGH